MPTYEYECGKCNYNFEVFQSISEDPVKKCPECGKGVRRLIFGGAGVIFKGSGFYTTDKAAKSSVSNTEKESAKPAVSSDTSVSTNTAADNSTEKKCARGNNKTCPNSAGKCA